MKILHVIFIVILFVSCEQKVIIETVERNEVGGLYSCDDGDGGYCVSKILALDENIVHVRLYKNTFESRPVSVDLSTLAIGTLDETDNFGIGHLPLTKEEFESWNPELLEVKDVREDELEGYRVWKNR